MLSKTDVANLALGYLGSSQVITDLDTDNFNYTKIFRRFLQTSLNTFLESHPWKIASKNAALALISEDPNSGYAFEYSVPADCLVVRQVAAQDSFIREYEQYENDKRHFEERLSGSGMTIHTDQDQAWIEYTKQLSLDGYFPEYFGRGLAAQLAMDTANQIIGNNFAKVKQTLMPQLMEIQENAIAVDVSRSPRKKDPDSPFISARY